MYILKDQEVQNLINKEFERQQNELEMIASENYVSKEVMMAYSNVFTNKYSEGYPGKRYYGWNQVVDEVEVLCQQRALQIFKLDSTIWGVNVQPLSGSPANLAVYLWVLNPHDKILWMSLDDGGHLSHGHPLNASGLYYQIIPYWVNEQTHLIDYDVLLEKALREKPQLILAWFSAYPRNIDWKKFSQVADEVEKLHGYRPILMADIAHIAWLIAWEVIEWPFEYFDIVTTTTHKTLRWPRWALIYFRNKEFTKNWKTETLEKAINRWVFPGLQWWPHEHIVAAKAIAFGEILNWDFKDYAKRVVENAKVLAEELVARWWPVFTDGTDNHIVLLDVTHYYDKDDEWISTWITWKIAEKTLEHIWISVNKNKFPFDPRWALDPSWLRLWTPAITTRGLWVEEIRQIADIISEALMSSRNEEKLNELKAQVLAICKKFPLNY